MPFPYSYCSASSTFSRAARRAGKIAARIPARIAAITNTTSVPDRDREGGVFDRLPDHQREHDADGDPERGADQGGDDALVADHAAHLAAGHADRAQHAELAGALEDGQHERVDDPEEADDDRQGEQHVEEVEQRVDPLLLVVLNWLSVWIFASGKPASARFESLRVGGVAPPATLTKV